MNPMNNYPLNRKRNTLIAAAGMLVISLLFSFGEYWDFTDGVLKETLFICADLILIAGIPFLIYKNRKINAWVGQKIDLLNLKGQYKTILKVFLLYLISIPVSVISGRLICALSGYPCNLIVDLCAVSIGLMGISVWLMKDHAMEKLDRLFLCAVMIIGTLFVVILPAELGYSWDDQIHFDRTLSAATLDGPYYQADEYMYLSAWNPAGSASRTERAERETLINNSYALKERTPYNHGDMRHLSIIGYLGYGIGTVLSRGMGLPYTLCFRLSKLMNILIYGLVISLGIRRLKYGKVLAAVIGLIPTGMYMASSYSYDPWLISFLILGFSYFFGALQRRDEKLTNREIAVMIGAFFIGCLPKAIYCVIMFPLLFMPRDKFASKKQYTAYLIFGFTAVLLLLSTFMLPRFLHGAGSGDERGGAEVNASEQVRFILNHPREYMRILFGFLKNEYLTGWSAGAYTANYAYLGADYSIWYAVPVLILIAALTDKIGTSGRTPYITVSAMISFVLLIMVIATSMYISFTPVAHPTVNGCQPRYLLPLLFPVWYINSFDRVSLKWNRNYYAAMFIMIMGMINILSVGIMVAGMY